MFCFEFWRILISFTLLLEYVVAQYAWFFSVTAVNIFMRSKDRLGEHLLDNTIFVKVFMKWSFGIQFRYGDSNSCARSGKSNADFQKFQGTFREITKRFQNQQGQNTLHHHSSRYIEDTYLSRSCDQSSIILLCLASL